MGKGLVRQSGAPAHCLFRVLKAQAGHNTGCRRGGIAHAYLSVAQDVIPVFLGIPGVGETHFHGLKHRIPGHGQTLGKIVRAPHKLVVVNIWAVEFALDAHVHQSQLHAVGLANHVDAALDAPGVKVHEGMGQLLGRGGNALGIDPVVRTEQKQNFLMEAVFHLSGNACHLDAHILQKSQASCGLQQLQLPLPGCLHGLLIQAGEFFFDFLPVQHHSILPFFICRSTWIRASDSFWLSSWDLTATR